MKLSRDYAIRLLKAGRAVITSSLGSSPGETAHTVKIWRMDTQRHNYYLAAPCETKAFVRPDRRNADANWGRIAPPTAKGQKK